jgi:hypothetical protein
MNDSPLQHLPKLVFLILVGALIYQFLPYRSIDPGYGSRASALERCKKNNAIALRDPMFQRVFTPDDLDERELLKTECITKKTLDPNTLTMAGYIVWLEYPSSGADPVVRRVLTETVDSGPSLTFPAD